ncbi:hypothetical protein ScPMuIL_003727 [Solemya velum]
MALHLASRSFISQFCLRTCCATFRSPIEFVRPFVSQTSQDVPKPPKKPLAAFFEFKAIKKEEIMKNNPGIKSTDVVRVAAEMWRNLDEEDKQIFKGNARERMQAYRIQYNDFISELSKEDLEKIAINKRQKKLARAKHTRKKELHKIWQAQNASVVLRFVHKSFKLGEGRSHYKILHALTDHLEFNAMPVEVSMVCYDGIILRQRFVEFRCFGPINLKLHTQVAQQKSLLGMVFGGEKPEVKVTVSDFMKGLGVIWREMPQEEKQLYKDEALKEKAIYEEKMKEWEQEMISVGREDLVRAKSRPAKPRQPKKKAQARSSKERKLTRKMTRSKTIKAKSAGKS